MLALQGNTAPYLQYAVARIRSIQRKASEQGISAEQVEAAAPRVVDDPERALALQLLQFAPTVAEVGSQYVPHKLAAYLFDLAQAFMSFYEKSPILKDASDDVRLGRLALAKLTERTLVAGLDLLGVQAPAQM